MECCDVSELAAASSSSSSAAQESKNKYPFALPPFSRQCVASPNPTREFVDVTLYRWLLQMYGAGMAVVEKRVQWDTVCREYPRVALAEALARNAIAPNLTTQEMAAKLRLNGETELADRLCREAAAFIRALKDVNYDKLQVQRKRGYFDDIVANHTKKLTFYSHGHLDLWCSMPQSERDSMFKAAPLLSLPGAAHAQALGMVPLQQVAQMAAERKLVDYVPELKQVLRYSSDAGDKQTLKRKADRQLTRNTSDRLILGVDQSTGYASGDASRTAMENTDFVRRQLGAVVEFEEARCSRAALFSSEGVSLWQGAEVLAAGLRAVAMGHGHMTETRGQVIAQLPVYVEVPDRLKFVAQCLHNAHASWTHHSSQHEDLRLVIGEAIKYMTTMAETHKNNVIAACNEFKQAVPEFTRSFETVYEGNYTLVLTTNALETLGPLMRFLKRTSRKFAEVRVREALGSLVDILDPTVANLRDLHSRAEHAVIAASGGNHTFASIIELALRIDADSRVEARYNRLVKKLQSLIGSDSSAWVQEIDREFQAPLVGNENEICGMTASVLRSAAETRAKQWKAKIAPLAAEIEKPVAALLSRWASADFKHAIKSRAVYPSLAPLDVPMGMHSVGKPHLDLLYKALAPIIARLRLAENKHIRVLLGPAPTESSSVDVLVNAVVYGHTYTPTVCDCINIAAQMLRAHVWLCAAGASAER